MLAGNVVTAAIREAALREQIAATEDVAALQERQLAITERLEKLGTAAQGDVVAQRLELAQTRALLPDQRRQLEQVRHRLAVLTGQPPGAARLPDRPKTLKLSSPFDYAANARALVVTDVGKDDARQVAAAMRELFLAAGGGGLGLFTAIRRLKAVHERIAAPLADKGLALYAQHVDPLEVGALVDIFRAEEDACLLGTDAIRESLRWFLDRRGTISLDTKLVLRVGDLAYLANRWSLSGGTMPDGSPAELGATTAEVARLQPDGTWLYVIGNAGGGLAA